jgi:RNA polymerase sigma-70 factor (ECF subfamily)
MIDFHDFYEQYAPDVYRFVVRLSGDPIHADDITAETFVRAWTGSGGKIKTTTAKAYLFTIARNIYLEYLRKTQRETELTPDQGDRSPGPEEISEMENTFEIIQKGLARLSVIDKSAFLMRVEHEFPYEEIARVLGISAAAARVKVHRARLKLASLLYEPEKRV